MGMLVEVHDGNVYWLRTEHPWEWRDVKWMKVEEQHSNALTPRMLLDMIETVSPYMGDGMLRPVELHELKPGASPEGVFKVVNPRVLMAEPLWSWGALLSVCQGCLRTAEVAQWRLPCD